jgi:hypothetical protein
LVLAASYLASLGIGVVASSSISAVSASAPAVALGSQQAPLRPPLVWRDLVRDAFKCPISLVLMHDPVVCADGHSYERANIEEWLTRSNRSPVTNLELEHKFLIANVTLKKAIEAEKALVQQEKHDM